MPTVTTQRYKRWHTKSGSVEVVHALEGPWRFMLGLSLGPQDNWFQVTLGVWTLNIMGRG